MSLIITIVFPTLCAYIFLSFFLSRQFPRNYETILNISFSVGLMLGVTSCTFFLWLFFLGFPSTNYQVIENIFAVILIPVAFYTSKYQKTDSCNKDTGSDFSIYLVFERVFKSPWYYLQISHKNETKIFQFNAYFTCILDSLAIVILLN